MSSVTADHNQVATLFLGQVMDLLTRLAVGQVAVFLFQGGVFHDQPVNAFNQAFIPSYVTYDFGVSLTRDIADRRTTFRLNGQNITSERYWASTGGLFLGQSLPMVVKFSVATNF